MKHTITKSGAFKACCSCGLSIDSAQEKYRDCQVENHVALVTGLRTIRCSTCTNWLGTINDGGLVIGPVYCQACTPGAEKQAVEVLDADI